MLHPSRKNRLVGAQTLPFQAIGAMLLASILALLVVFAAVAQARESSRHEALIKALDLDSLIEIMRAEGVDYGAGLQDELFPGRGGASWRAQVELIYRPERLWSIFGPRFEAELDGHDTAPALAFFTSDLGRRVITLEISARRAQLDKAVEDMAVGRMQQMRDDNDPRIDLVGQMIDANDLIDLNVVGALNSNFAFYRGLAQGNAFPEDMSEDQMLRDVWAQEDEVRADTEKWLYGYLVMAYQPLSDDELRRYIAFSRSKAGQVINTALFNAFDAMFDDVSFALGQAAAQQITGEEL